jgi:spore cortex formation protein SpoVR/YcgB (stage V sporulation)
MRASKIPTKTSKLEKQAAVSLTYGELNNVIEALLFASSVNVCADWGYDQCEKFLDLAITLKNKLPKSVLSLKNVVYYDDDSLQESWTQKLQQNFNVDTFNIKSLSDDV